MIDKLSMTNDNLVACLQDELIAAMRSVIMLGYHATTNDLRTDYLGWYTQLYALYGTILEQE